MRDQTWADLLREAGIEAPRRPPPFRNRDRYTTRPRAVDPGSPTTSVAGQVAPTLRREDLRPLPTRQEQERAYARAQQRQPAGEAYQAPRNQFAEAGQYGLEMTGLPSIRRSAAAFADDRPREGFEQGALGLLGVATLGVGGRGARAPRTAPPVRAPQPPTRIYRGIVPDESRRSALGDRWWSDNPETASTYAPAAADGAHVVPGLLDESGFLAVEAPPGTMFRSIPVSSLPPEIRRAFPRTTQTVSTHEVAAAAESQGYRGVTFSGIRDGGYGGGPEPYGGFQTGDGGRVIAVFDDSMVQSPFQTGGAALRPPPMRAPVAEPSGALRPPSARIARPGEIEQAGGAYTSDDVRYPHEFADDPGAAAAYEIPDATNVNRGPRRPLLMPPRQLGTASDGSVMPVRPPEPFRQSMVGGSDDLAEAARPGALRPAPDGSPSAGRSQSPDAGPSSGGSAYTAERILGRAPTPEEAALHSDGFDLRNDYFHGAGTGEMIGLRVRGNPHRGDFVSPDEFFAEVSRQSRRLVGGERSMREGYERAVAALTRQGKIGVWGGNEATVWNARNVAMQPGAGATLEGGALRPSEHGRLGPGIYITPYERMATASIPRPNAPDGGSQGTGAWTALRNELREHDFPVPAAMPDLPQVEVPLSELRPGQIGSLDRADARNYAALTTDAPPILVRRQGRGWHIIDGNRRAEAARLRGDQNIRVLDASRLFETQPPNAGPRQ